MTDRIGIACALLLIGFSAVARAQPAVQTSDIPLQAPVTDSDKAFSESLLKMPLEEALATIAQSPLSRITIGLATALRDAGGEFTRTQPLKALEIYGESLAVADRAGAPLMQANLFFALGDAHRMAGDMEEALADYDRSSAIYLAANAGPVRLAKPLVGKGLLRLALGDYEGAIEAHRAALKLNEQAGNRIGMARDLNNLGNAQISMGDFRAGRQSFELGLAIAREQKEKRGESLLLNNIANTYLKEDNPKLAASYCLESIRIKEAAGVPEDLVTSLINLAQIYLSDGKLADVRQVLVRALDLAHAANKPVLVAQVLSIVGDLEVREKHYEAALAGLTNAIASARKVEDHRIEFDIREQIARVEYLMGRYTESLRDAEAVVAAGAASSSQQLVADGYDTAGRAQFKLGRSEQSRIAFENSVAAYEYLRANTAGGDSARSEFLAHHTDAYQGLVALNIAQGRNEDALRVSERQKGRALLDLLTRGRSSLATELTPQERAEQAHLKMRLSTAETQRRNATGSAPSLDAQLTGARTALDAFRERMSVAHPEMDRKRGNAPEITLAQAAKFLPDSATAILEYEVTPESTFLFVITAGKEPELHLHTIAISSQSLSARIARLSRSLGARDPGFAADAGGLYRLLLAPAAAELAGKHSLVIVPSGDLWHVPFQALRDAAGKYVVETAAVSYEPSLSVLNVTSEHAIRAGHSLLVFGDPAGNLPEAAREARTIAALYGSSGSSLFIGATATKANLTAGSKRFDIVHLATHGSLDDRDPMYSHLVLAGAGGTAQLDASEIADMQIPASLVVLSACQTAEGRYQDGEGLIGLSWSFLAAGAESVVASQWRVESSSTTDLMIAFHRNLRLSAGKAEALRRAELAIARDPRYGHPFYWAGFVLVGKN